MLLRQDFSTDPDYPDHLYFPTTPNYSDDAIDDCFMSGQTFQFNDPFSWSANVPLFGGQSQPQQFPHDSQGFAGQANDNSFDFYSQGAPQQHHPREWQLYDNGHFNAQALNHDLLSPQGRISQHRRALSNSTATSQASTASPQQYPANYDSSYLEAFSHSGYQNYPTPSQTPTQDSFMDQNPAWRSRVGTNSELAQKGQRGSLASVTSEPSQHSNMAANQSMQNQTFEYPATPKTANGDFGDRQVKPQANVTRSVPALARTISDIYQDELYNPVSSSMHQPSIHQPVGKPSTLSPHSSVMSDRLQAAYEARSSHSPVAVQREPSPFRPDSPYAMSSTPFGQIPAGQVGTAAGQRRQQKAEADAHAYHAHHMIPDDSAPKTISPQQAYLDDFHDPAEDSSVPLFQQNSSSQPQLFDNGHGRLNYGPLNTRGQATNGNFNFQPTSMPAMAQRQTPTLSQNRSSGGSVEDEPDFPAHLISMETSKSEPEPESSAESEVERPASTAADTGPYTCTFHRCNQRFASPALLHRHKREAHRPTATSSTKPADRASPRSSSGGAESSVSPPKNSQAGPHRCDSINPSTGKPCNAVFSRPYDLTRHEDTIHARRGKVQCQYCTEEKTFSRADALTRHMRVVHPSIDFPGKHRRRHGD